MDIKEYKQMLIDDFRATALANESSPSKEFINFAVDVFNDTEEVFDLIPCFFTMNGPNNKKILIDGYSYEEADKSYTFFVSKFDDNQELTTITQTEIDGYIKNMATFVEASLNRYIQKNTDISCEGNQIADMLWRRYSAGLVSKFQFYIITNSLLSDRVKNIRDKALLDKTVEIKVWDIQRFYNSDVNNRQKEPIFIDVKKYCNGHGLPAIKAFDGGEDEYIAYLAVIPGVLLAQIYDEFGSRLLEGNVRSFLSASGKVNKGIKETILKSPKYFFTYNNGIATTASDITTEMTNNGLEITSIKDLQIINGGQTTASLLNTKINYKNDTHLEDIYVAMKLTVIKSNNFSNMVENISRCANSQNKVSDADFFSNSAFHITFEKLSKSHPSPAVNGNQYQTYWFYERARGSYKQEQMKLTKAQRDKFALLYPKNQMITKTDLAKYMNSYFLLPYEVSKGAQKNMKSFAERIIKIEENSENNINEFFFKKAIALAIIFKTLEIDISKSEWFPEGSGYRANIVTYTIAKLFYSIYSQTNKYEIDYNLIWNKQRVYPELKSILLDLAYKTFVYINRPDRLLMNISEWCKKEECWNRYKNEIYTLPKYFLDTLLTKGESQEFERNAKKDKKLDNEMDIVIQVVNLGSDYWERLMNKAKEYGICNVIEEGDLRIAIRMNSSGRVPNTVQAKRLIQFRDKCSNEGIDVEKI